MTVADHGAADTVRGMTVHVASDSLDFDAAAAQRFELLCDLLFDDWVAVDLAFEHAGACTQATCSVQRGDGRWYAEQPLMLFNELTRQHAGADRCSAACSATVMVRRT